MKKVLKGLILILLILLAIPVVILYFMPSQLISKEVAYKNLSLPASRYLLWRGDKLHYIDEGRGMPVLMIHGFGGSARNFSNIAEALRDSFRVIRVDLPGFGLSDLPSLGEHPDYVQMYRDYITFIIDTLQLDSVCIMGNSMGGGIAWLAAGDHPDKVVKLVLLNSAGYDAENISSKLTMFKYESVGHIFDKGIPSFVSKNRAQTICANPNKVNPEVWELNNLFTNREGNIQNMLTLARAHQFPDTNLIKRVQCPTLIIWGRQDIVIPEEHAERFHRDIKNSRIIIYDPCGHVPMMECPEILKKDFIHFVKES